MVVRANGVWKRSLREYQAPAIAPAVDEALIDYMTRGKAAMPDSDI